MECNFEYAITAAHPHVLQRSQQFKRAILHIEMKYAWDTFMTYTHVTFKTRKTIIR